MKIAEITPKTDAELVALLADSRKQLAQLAIDSRTKQAANLKEIHAAKKTVARVLTVQRQRQLQEQEQAVEAAPAATATPTPLAEATKQEAHHG